MSYIDQANGSRRVAVGGVVLLHIVIGYALISGFAITVLQPPIKRFIAEEIRDADPPPVHKVLPPPPKSEAMPDPRPTDIIKVPDLDARPLTYVDPIPTGGESKPIVVPLPPQPKITTHARAPIPGAGRAGWVTTDDYPPSALRDEVQGVVGIDVTVGADGRVSACSVAASSGSDVLDQATCRLYARRARFQSALDDDGKATVGHYADRIRWTIPAQ